MGAGGQFLELCTDCVTEVAAGTISTVGTQVTLAAGDKVMVSGQTHQQLLASVKTAVARGTAINTGTGLLTGLPAELTAQNGAGGAGNALAGTARLNLYKALNSGVFTPVIVPTVVPVTPALASVTVSRATSTTTATPRTPL